MSSARAEVSASGCGAGCSTSHSVELALRGGVVAGVLVGRGIAVRVVVILHGEATEQADHTVLLENPIGDHPRRLGRRR